MCRKIVRKFRQVNLRFKSPYINSQFRKQYKHKNPEQITSTYPIKLGTTNHNDTSVQQSEGSRVVCIFKQAKLPQVFTPIMHSSKGVRKYHQKVWKQNLMNLLTGCVFSRAQLIFSTNTLNATQMIIAVKTKTIVLKIPMYIIIVNGSYQIMIIMKGQIIVFIIKYRFAFKLTKYITQQLNEVKGDHSHISIVNS